MNRVAPRKLTSLHLSRETLRRLEARQLEEALGGCSIPAWMCGDTNDTCDNCPTYSCGPLACN